MHHPCNAAFIHFFRSAELCMWLWPRAHASRHGWPRHSWKIRAPTCGVAAAAVSANSQPLHRRSEYFSCPLKGKKSQKCPSKVCPNAAGEARLGASLSGCTLWCSMSPVPVYTTLSLGCPGCPAAAALATRHCIIANIRCLAAFLNYQQRRSQSVWQVGQRHQGEYNTTTDIPAPV